MDSPPDIWSEGEMNSEVVKPGQWAEIEPGEYIAVPQTVYPLPVGVYSHHNESRGIYFRREKINVDELIALPDSIADELLHEIDVFLADSEKFKQRKLLHKRGYLFYGSQGSGKTSLVHRITKRILDLGGISFIFKTSPYIFSKALAEFRRWEPDRMVICHYEDLDEIAKDEEKDLLAILDGESQIEHVIHVATTNNFDKLDSRIVDRPRRFDRIIKYDKQPDTQMRHKYLSQKLINSPLNECLEELVVKTEGLSIAALTEFVVSIDLLGNSVDDTLERLKPKNKKLGF